MKRLSLEKTYWYQQFIAPRSSTPDDQRHELVLNTLLLGVIVASLLADFATVGNHLTDTTQVANSLVEVLGFTIILSVFLWLSRKGHFKVVSYVFLGFVLISAVAMLVLWGFMLPATQLAFIIALVLTGVLLPAKRALWLTFGMAVIILALSYMQVQGALRPDTSWVTERVKFADSFGFVSGLIIVGLVSWLANREIDRSLDRARRSEAELEAERDQLEVKVVERTRELERAQLERVIELQRLAEFGRLSAGLLHDVASPLTVASLNLKELGGKSEDLLVRQALQSLHYIERFLASARKQLKAQSDIGNFGVSSEIRQVVSMLNHRAREASVTVELKPGTRFKLLGDPVKFSQIMANLILNAIEAYERDIDPPLKRKVAIEARQEGKWTVVSVNDHGRGLKKSEMDRIFDTFYSTHDSSGTNMGIGLATVKRLVENDFEGKVKVSSSPRRGTTFTVYLRDATKGKD
jgi:signal transduction histidine kinase